jgi:hypothetical protein
MSEGAKRGSVLPTAGRDAEMKRDSAMHLNMRNGAGSNSH